MKRKIDILCRYVNTIDMDEIATAPSGEQLPPVSQPVQPHSRNMLFMVIGILLILLFGLLGFLVVSNKKTTFTQVIPTTQVPTPTVPIKEQYNNPFDAKSQYKNPFEQSSNPFDALAK